MLNPVIKNRLHEEIVSQIQKMILNSEFTVGEKLPTERDLAATFNVNRATVREALKKLEILGLVEIFHGDGIYVKNYLESGNIELLKSIIYLDDNINVDLMKSLLDIRKIISPPMAAFAAEKRSEEEIIELENIISDTSLSTLEKDVSVHRIIALASKNIFYTFILNFFNQMFHDYGHLYFNDNKNREETKKFHSEILEAIRIKDKKNAEKIMHNILLYSEKKIYKSLTKKVI